MAAISGGAAAAVIGGGALMGGLAGMHGRDKQKNLSTSSVSNPWGEQIPYLKQIFSEAKDIYETPKEYYPHQTYVSPSASTLEGLDAQYNRASQGSELFNTAKDQNLATIGGDYLNSNPYLDGAIQNANEGLINSFNNSVIPQLQSSFSGAGRYGSGLHQQAESDASKNLLDQMGKNATNMSYGNYSDERNRMSNAVANAPQFAMADYNDIANLLDVGQQREVIQQQGVDDSLARYDFEQNERTNSLADYLGFIDGNYGGTTTTTGRNPNYKSRSSALIGGLMGGAGMGASMIPMGAGAGGAAMSDIRTKENISLVGNEKGFNIYEFNYKGKPFKRFRGVMAQEVQKVIPQAVTKLANGFLAVFYDKIGLKMEEV